MKRPGNSKEPGIVKDWTTLEFGSAPERPEGLRPVEAEPMIRPRVEVAPPVEERVRRRARQRKAAPAT